MLRTITTALVATALIAGPALAAQPSSNTAAAPAVKSAPAATATSTANPAAPATATKQADVKTPEANKPAKTVKHSRKLARRHVAHVAHVAHVTKTPAKTIKSQS